MSKEEAGGTAPAGVEAEASASAGADVEVSAPAGADVEVSAPAGADVEVSAPAGDAGEAVEQPTNVAAATTTEPGKDADADRPGVVIRDKRKVRDPAKAEAAQTDAGQTDAGRVDAARTEPAAADVVEEEPITVDAVLVEPAETGTPLGAELESLRRTIDELTRDLQRMMAEYANYRKRVERDKGLVGEAVTGTVLIALLPVLDDIDRAREHGDLVGPFGSVAEQLVNALTKFGLTPFGEKGDTFDPTRHEAVAHQTSTEVTESTCVDILRRGYLLGERLLRPALVAVADPE